MLGVNGHPFPLKELVSPAVFSVGVAVVVELSIARMFNMQTSNWGRRIIYEWWGHCAVIIAKIDMILW